MRIRHTRGRRIPGGHGLVFIIQVDQHQQRFAGGNMATQQNDMVPAVLLDHFYFRLPLKHRQYFEQLI